MGPRNHPLDPIGESAGQSIAKNADALSCAAIVSTRAQLVNVANAKPLVPTESLLVAMNRVKLPLRPVPRQRRLGRAAM
ncbi:hypothetical protein NW762_003121 [Fusarium torreyae]|uniref:Uncharacterized protein n=1 Tax=Fusarium torreyae TaxID=1237075 RepID=A0A9W8S9U1_9HYPO|nr:hypothetical protein NW762_003121 [Fusarium torreyae]